MTMTRFPERTQRLASDSVVDVLPSLGTDEVTRYSFVGFSPSLSASDVWRVRIASL